MKNGDIVKRDENRCNFALLQLFFQAAEKQKAVTHFGDCFYLPLPNTAKTVERKEFVGIAEYIVAVAAVVDLHIAPAYLPLLCYSSCMGLYRLWV